MKSFTVREFKEQMNFPKFYMGNPSAKACDSVLDHALAMMPWVHIYEGEIPYRLKTVGAQIVLDKRDLFYLNPLRTSIKKTDEWVYIQSHRDAKKFIESEFVHEHNEYPFPKLFEPPEESQSKKS